MKKVLAAAALMALAACAGGEKKDEMPAMDSAPAEMAPPATDTMAPKTDSMAPADTTMPRDTAQTM